MIKKLILVRLQEIMLWIDCYIEEGTIFREIEETGRINKFLYQLSPDCPVIKYQI